MTVQDFWWFEKFHTQLKLKSNRTKLNLAKRLISNDLLKEFGYENNTFYAEIYDLKNRNTDEIYLKFSPLNERTKEKIIDTFFYSSDDIIEFLNGKFPQEYADEKHVYLLNLLLDTTHISVECSCNSRALQCEHTYVILLKIAEIIKYNPLFLFKIKIGLDKKELLPFLFEHIPNNLTPPKLPPFLDRQNYTRLEYKNNCDFTIDKIKSYMGKSDLDYKTIFTNLPNKTNNSKEFNLGYFDNEYFEHLSILKQDIQKNKI